MTDMSLVKFVEELGSKLRPDLCFFVRGHSEPGLLVTVEYEAAFRRRCAWRKAIESDITTADGRLRFREEDMALMRALPKEKLIVKRIIPDNDIVTVEAELRKLIRLLPFFELLHEVTA